jgi:hypothetical protein
MVIWNILQPFGTFCIHLAHFSSLGIMHQEKSGYPEQKSQGSKRRIFRFCLLPNPSTAEPQRLPRCCTILLFNVCLHFFQALFLLLQCGYNSEEALRRRRMNAVPPADTMSLW